MKPVQPVAVYIGLGSNLENPEQQVRQALIEIGDLPETRLAASSGLYRSAPVGPGPQDDYINAVALVQTHLDPQDLLAKLQALETHHGRERTLRWGPRTLDLDILLYGEYRISSPALEVPHPRLAERNFVLFPLSEVAPSLILPDGTRLAELLANVPSRGIVRVGDI